MKLKDIPIDTKINTYLLAIPKEGIEQLTDTPLTEGYIVSMHAKPGGWFMSPDPPDSPTRRLIPTYGNPRDMLEWDIIEK